MRGTVVGIGVGPSFGGAIWGVVVLDPDDVKLSVGDHRTHVGIWYYTLGSASDQIWFTRSSKVVTQSLNKSNIAS